MDIEEAAKHLGVSVRTLRRWVASGRVQARKVTIPSGTRLEFEPADLDGLKGTLLPELLDGAGANGQPEGMTQSDRGDDTVDQGSDSLPDIVRQPPSTITLVLPEELVKALSRGSDTNGQGGDTSSLSSIEALPYLLTVEETAAFLRVGKGRVLELLRAGKLRGIRGMGRGWRVKREDLRQFVEGL